MLKPKARGFTAIELMVVLVILGIVIAVALPSFQAQVRKARRADAQAALAQIQQAQERWRTRQPRYAASLADLGLPTASPAGHYGVATAVDDTTAATAYIVSASAAGPQAQDVACRYLRVLASGGMLSHQSGPDSGHGNGADANRACWSQ